MYSTIRNQALKGNHIIVVCDTMHDADEAFREAKEIYKQDGFEGIDHVSEVNGHKSFRVENGGRISFRGDGARLVPGESTDDTYVLMTSRLNPPPTRTKHEAELLTFTKDAIRTVGETNVVLGDAATAQIVAAMIEARS